jgi:hypothetical protein
MPVITDEDISRVVSSNAFDAGLEYHLEAGLQRYRSQRMEPQSRLSVNRLKVFADRH